MERYAIDLAWVVVLIDADRPAINAGRSHFAPHPHRAVIPADQSGQIPARVLRLSHSAKKSKRSFGGANFICRFRVQFLAPGLGSRAGNKETPDEEFAQRKFIGEPPRLEDPDTPSPCERLR
jgi:hypothetical protein